MRLACSIALLLLIFGCSNCDCEEAATAAAPNFLDLAKTLYLPFFGHLGRMGTPAAVKSRDAKPSYKPPKIVGTNRNRVKSSPPRKKLRPPVKQPKKAGTTSSVPLLKTAKHKRANLKPIRKPRPVNTKPASHKKNIQKGFSKSKANKKPARPNAIKSYTTTSKPKTTAISKLKTGQYPTKSALNGVTPSPTRAPSSSGHPTSPNVGTKTFTSLRYTTSASVQLSPASYALPLNSLVDSNQNFSPLQYSAPIGDTPWRPNRLSDFTLRSPNEGVLSTTFQPAPVLPTYYTYRNKPTVQWTPMQQSAVSHWNWSPSFRSGRQFHPFMFQPAPVSVQAGLENHSPTMRSLIHRVEDQQLNKRW